MKFPKLSNKDWFGWAVIVCIGVTLFGLLSNISSVKDQAPQAALVSVCLSLFCADPAERGRLYPQAKTFLECAWRIRRRYSDFHHCSWEYVRDSGRADGYTGGGDPEFCLPGVLYEE